jgi:hypothetical protein
MTVTPGLVARSGNVRRTWLVVATTALAGLGGIAGAVAAEPPRVTGISSALDAAETGNHLGPGTAYGVATGVVFTPFGSLPPEAAPVVEAVADAWAVPPQQFAAMQEGGTQAIDAARGAAAPLAAANGPANSAVETAAGQLESSAGQYGPIIQPLDTTATELATTLRGLTE